MTGEGWQGGDRMTEWVTLSRQEGRAALCLQTVVYGDGCTSQLAGNRGLKFLHRVSEQWACVGHPVQGEHGNLRLSQAVN